MTAQLSAVFEKITKDICSFVIFSTNFKVPNPVARSCQSSFRGCESCPHKNDCSHTCSFPDMALFVTLQKNVSNNLNFMFLKFEIPNSAVGGSQSTLGVANLLSKCDCSNPGNFRNVTFFYGFFKKNV